MGRFKTQRAEERRGTLRFLGLDDDLNYNVEIACLRSGVNRNRWDYRNVERHAKTFAGVPILCAYIGNRVGDGHNMRLKRDPKTGEEYYSFTDSDAEKIVGMLSEDVSDIRVETRGKEQWVIARGKIWRFYNRELADKLAAAKALEVSSETEVFDAREGNGGVEVFEDWRAVGVTILHETVAPAIPGANVKALTAMRGRFGELKAAALENHEERLRHAQKKQTEKGKSMDRKELRELEKLFDGYRVTGATEDGMTVCLMSADGAPYSYTYTQGENRSTIVKERIERCSARCVWSLGENTVSVDMTELTAALGGDIAALSARCEELEKRAQTAENKVCELEKAEDERRRAECEREVERTVCEINEALDSGEQLSKEDCAEIIEGCRNGAYSALSEDGKWTGAEKAKADVKALAMNKVLETRERRRMRVIDWSRGAGGGAKAPASAQDVANEILGRR